MRVITASIIVDAEGERFAATVTLDEPGTPRDVYTGALAVKCLHALVGELTNPAWGGYPVVTDTPPNG